MKKAAIICFTENGKNIAEKAGKCLCEHEYTVTLAKKYKDAPDYVQESLDVWTRREFRAQDALVFIGAAGIAVRAVAPYIRSKSEDPAVIVIDEQGRYCIPILSGHIGGANELAELISADISAVPVITTATDLNKKWAADVFAKKNGLKILDLKRAKEVSARILSGERIFMHIDRSCGQIQGEMPEEVQLWEEKREEDDENGCGFERKEPAACRKGSVSDTPDAAVGIYRNPIWSRTLHMVPRTVVLGIGCRKGTSAEKIEDKIIGILEKNGIFLESICKIASIDLKQDETGIQGVCRKYGWEFETFPAEALQRAKGTFTASGFVKQVTGVDNICERSAVCGSGGGSVIIEKLAGDGVTVAAAVREWGVRFE